MMTSEGRKSPVHVHVDRETPVHVHLKKKKKGKAGVPTAVEQRLKTKRLSGLAKSSVSYDIFVILYFLNETLDPD